jgi:hypothetical protein
MSANKGKPKGLEWTAEHDDFVRAGILDGLTVAQISASMVEAGLPARTRNSIIGRMARLRGGATTHGGKRTVRVRERVVAFVKKVAPVVDRTAGAASDKSAWTLFLDAARNQCRWIVDESQPIASRMVCGQPVTEAGKSWCAACSAVVWSRGTPSERSAIRDALKVAA